MEQWRDIEGYEGFYQVSNMGRVKSLHNGKENFLKPSTDKDGYLHVSLCRDKKYKRCSVHRLVIENFTGNPENKPQVNHIDGNKQNNRVDNLEWCTSRENIQHAVAMGLSKRGENHRFAKLTNADVEWIRNHYIPRDKEFGQVALARRFNVTSSAISLIVRGNTYTVARGKISDKYDKRKLSEEDIRYIRERHIPKHPKFGARALGRRFGVAHHVIRHIVSGKIYKDID